MSETLNLYQKISAVMQDIQYLKKDDSVSTGASGSYKAMSEEKVTETVRKSLITHGLVILPVSQSHSREELRDKENVLKGYLSIVETQYKIVDVDTGQFEILASGGSGADSQDKGVGKAMTYSYKYLLLRTFAIPTGDDPDKVSSATLDEQHEKEKGENRQPPKTSQEVGQDRVAQEREKAEARKQSAPTGQQGDSGSTMARVYKLREEMSWGWPDLTQFASEVLGREMKYLKKDVTNEGEWKMIEAAILISKNAAS